MSEAHFTLAEAARILGIAPSTCQSLAAYGHLKLSFSEINEKPKVSESSILQFATDKWSKLSDPEYRGKRMQINTMETIRENIARHKAYY